jgi:hypothetical protein
MNNKQYVARSSDIAARRLGDETMIMSASDSTLFTLNPVATAIWEGADGVTALEDIVRTRVCPIFEVDPDVALRDAQTLAERLATHGILLLSDAPFPGPNPGA